MPKLSPLMVAPPAIFLAFAVLAGVGMFRENPDELPSTRVGAQAPAVTDAALGAFPNITDETLRSGEVTLVNFWASWCPPCRAEHPKLLEMQAEGVRIVGVNIREEAEDAIGYLERYENPFVAIAADRMGRSAIDWGVTAPPETFIVDGDGTVLFRFVGPLVGSAYEQRFVPALNDAMGVGG